MYDTGKRGARRGCGDQWSLRKQYLNPKGYLSVILQRDGKPKTFRTSRLVLTVFIGPCPDGMEACHNNGIRADNRIGNLKWGTPKENSADKVSHGTMIMGERAPAHKLTEAAVREMRRDHHLGVLTYAEAGRRYGITRSTAKKVIDGRLWRHVNEQ